MGIDKVKSFLRRKEGQESTEYVFAYSPCENKGDFKSKINKRRCYYNTEYVEVMEPCKGGNRFYEIGYNKNKHFFNEGLD